MKIVLIALSGIIIGVAGVSRFETPAHQEIVVKSTAPPVSYPSTIPVEHIEFEPLHIDVDAFDSDAGIIPQ